MQKAVLAIVAFLAAGGIALLVVSFYAPASQPAIQPTHKVFFRSEVEGFDDRIIIHLIPAGGGVESCLASWSVAEDGNTLIDRKDQKISHITAENHIILEIPRKAGSAYTVGMVIRSPDGQELDNATLTIGPLSLPA